MKPHFGQSDAAMNKLAGCNVLPNNNKPADLARRDIPCSCIPCKHYESSLDEVPCKYCRDHAKFEEKEFDPVAERDAAYDLGYKDAQKAQGYYGHHNGCDCAVCEDMHNTELRRKIVDAEWNKLLDDNKRLTVLLDEELKNVVYAQYKWAEAEERVEKWKAFYDSAAEGCANQVEGLTDRMGRDVQYWKRQAETAIREHARTLTQIGADADSLRGYMDRMGKYEKALEQIASQPLEPAHIYEIADRIKLIAKVAL